MFNYDQSASTMSFTVSVEFGWIILTVLIGVAEKGIAVDAELLAP